MRKKSKSRTVKATPFYPYFAKCQQPESTCNQDYIANHLDTISMRLCELFDEVYGSYANYYIARVFGSCYVLNKSEQQALAQNNVQKNAIKGLALHLKAVAAILGAEVIIYSEAIDIPNEHLEE